MEKRLFLAAGAVMMLFCSIPYSWAMVSVPLNEIYGWSEQVLGFTFSLGIGSFCIGSIISGLIFRKIYFRLTCICGICCLAAGFFMMITLHSLWQLYLGYGVCLCLGAGILYNVIMTNVLKWFSKHSGIVSGILLMGFGFGSSVIGGFASWGYSGWGYQKTMLILAVVIIFVELLGTFLIKNMQENSNEEPAFDVQDTTAMLHSTDFWKYFCWSTLLGATALIVVGNSVTIAGELIDSRQKITMIVGLISIFNGMGRLVGGYIMDHTGSKKLFVVLNIGFLTAELLLLLALLKAKPMALMMSYMLLGVCYGGIFTCNSAYIRRIFGSRNYAIHFSIINMSLFAAGFLGPMLAVSMLKKGSVPAVLLMLGLTAVSAVIMQGIKTHVYIPTGQKMKRSTKNEKIYAEGKTDE